jgi:hypothetical protein
MAAFSGSPTPGSRRTALRRYSTTLIGHRTFRSRFMHLGVLVLIVLSITTALYSLSTQPGGQLEGLGFEALFAAARRAEDGQ